MKKWLQTVSQHKKTYLVIFHSHNKLVGDVNGKFGKN